MIPLEDFTDEDEDGDEDEDEDEDEDKNEDDRGLHFFRLASRTFVLCFVLSNLCGKRA